MYLESGGEGREGRKGRGRGCVARRGEVSGRETSLAKGSMVMVMDKMRMMEDDAG